MGFNTFDNDFDSFDEDDSFGNSNKQSESNNNFGSDSDGFGSEISDFEKSGIEEFGDSDFGGTSQFETKSTEDGKSDTKSLKMKAGIMVAVGFVVLVGAVAVVSRLNKGSDTTEISNVTSVSVTSKAVQETASESNNKGGWVELDKSTKFTEKEVKLNFTVTDIKHYARAIDNGTLETKTVLNGSISGFAGTYILDVPFMKGVKLTVGDSFEVTVYVGDYNGKSIIDSIRY